MQLKQAKDIGCILLSSRIIAPQRGPPHASPHAGNKRQALQSPSNRLGKIALAIVG